MCHLLIAPCSAWWPHRKSSGPPSAELHCATFPIYSRRKQHPALTRPRAPELPPPHHPPTHCHSCLSELWPGGRKQDARAVVFVKITEGPRPQLLRIKCRRRPAHARASAAACSALMRLNNILDYLEWGHGGRGSRSCSWWGIKRWCFVLFCFFFFCKCKSDVFYLHQHVFYNKRLSHCQDMMWRAATVLWNVHAITPEGFLDSNFHLLTEVLMRLNGAFFHTCV